MRRVVKLKVLAMARFEGYRRPIYLGIIIIALGIVINTTLKTSLGTVLIAVGGLFFITGMSRKKKREKNPAL